MMMTITAMVSGTLATAVRRWCQNTRVPWCAEPRWRTRPSGVRIGSGDLLGHRMPPITR